MLYMSSQRVRFAGERLADVSCFVLFDDRQDRDLFNEQARK